MKQGHEIIDEARAVAGAKMIRAPFAVLRLDTLELLKFSTRDETKNAIVDLFDKGVPVVVLKFSVVAQCYAVQTLKL